jgi:hypothetical protein
MAFRLSIGDVVCNLDADNFLGEGFAFYILSLFNEEDETFFCTPQYSERDVIERECVRREHFFVVHGYDETLAGYGLEDIDFYDWLESVGLWQKLLPIEHYYSAIHHSHEERISQEYMGRHVKKMYLSYINPYTTEVILEYDSGIYEKALLVDNLYYNYNESAHYTSVNKLIFEKKYRTLREGDWTTTKWEDMEKHDLPFYEMKN